MCALLRVAEVISPLKVVGSSGDSLSLSNVLFSNEFKQQSLVFLKKLSMKFVRNATATRLWPHKWPVAHPVTQSVHLISNFSKLGHSHIHFFFFFNQSLNEVNTHGLAVEREGGKELCLF